MTRSIYDAPAICLLADIQRAGNLGAFSVEQSAAMVDVIATAFASAMEIVRAAALGAASTYQMGGPETAAALTPETKSDD